MFFFLKKDYIVRLLRSNALRKGLLGGSPFWRVVWGLQLANKAWNKLTKDKDDAPIVFDESLEEGGVWALVHEPEQSRKGRGEGRKMLVGPKRSAPRANVMTGTALATIGGKILEAPSAERINAILGTEAVADPPPSRYQKRAAKKAAKRSVKTAKQDAKKHVKATKVQAKATAKQADRDAKAAATQAKADARAAAKKAKATAKQSRLDAKAASKQRAIDEKASAKAAKAEARAAAKASRRTKTTNERDDVIEIVEVGD